MRALLAGVCLLCACENGSTLAHPELFPSDDSGMDASVDTGPVRMLDARVMRTFDAFVNLPKTPDARVEADGAVTPGWVAELDGLSCTTPDSVCQSAPEKVDYTGDSPLGPVHISELGLVYSTGFGTGTELTLYGTAGGRPIQLVTRVETSEPTQHPQRPLCAPGQYDSRLPAGSPHFLSNTLIYCGKNRSLEEVVLTVNGHQRLQSEAVFAADALITLTGTLRVSGGGWSLQIPLTFSRNCGFWILD